MRLLDFQLVAGGIDLGFAAGGNASALAICGYDRTNLFQTLIVDEITPPKNQALKPGLVFERFGKICEKYGCRRLMADGHYIESARETFAKFGISIEAAPAKDVVHIAVRDLARDDRIRVTHRYPELRAQLRTILSRAKAGGTLSISAPVRKGGLSHADSASAWILAMYLVSRNYVPYSNVHDSIHFPGESARTQRAREKALCHVCSKDDRVAYCIHADDPQTPDRNSPWGDESRGVGLNMNKGKITKMNPEKQPEERPKFDHGLDLDEVIPDPNRPPGPYTVEHGRIGIDTFSYAPSELKRSK